MINEHIENRYLAIKSIIDSFAFQQITYIHLRTVDFFKHNKSFKMSLLMYPAG